MLRSATHKRCPWCGVSTRISHLGKREPANPPRWFQFTRPTLVCPNCAKPVALSEASQKWVLLAAPALIASLTALFSPDFAALISRFSPFLMAALGALAAVGLIGYAMTVRLERAKE